MAKLDVDQINRNRRIVADSTQETPWNAAIEDSDSDYAERLYDQVPKDKVGFMPPTEDE